MSYKKLDDWKKSLAISKIVRLSLTTTVPPTVINELNIFEQLWTTFSLKYVDIFTKVISLKPG